MVVVWRRCVGWVSEKWTPEGGRRRGEIDGYIYGAKLEVSRE